MVMVRNTPVAEGGLPEVFIFTENKVPALRNILQKQFVDSDVFAF